MRKILLFSFMAFFSVISNAQEVEIFYPTLQYDTGKGFTKKNITIGDVETDLWKRSTADLPTETALGYTRTGVQTIITSKAYGANGASYGITDTYAVIDAVDLSVYPTDQHFKLTFFNKAQYGLGNFSVFSVLLTENYTGDPTTTSWTNVTSQLDQIDDDVAYDANWTKSTLNLNNWKSATNLVVAFRYQVTKAGKVDNVKDSPTPDRPGLWRVCEVRFSHSDTPTALNELSIDKSKLVFPNPATDKIQFCPEITLVDIYNINGTHLKQQFLTSQTMDIAEYPAGIYLLKLTLKNGTVITNKLLKR